MPQMHRGSEMWLIILADGTPALLPGIAQICKAQGCFDGVEALQRSCCLSTELSQHDCSRDLAPDVQRLKSPGSSGFDPASKLVWIQLGVSPFWAELQQILCEWPMF